MTHTYTNLQKIVSFEFYPQICFFRIFILMSIFLFWLKRKKTTTIDAISKSGSGEEPPMRKTAYNNSPMAEVQTLSTAGT